MAEGWGSVKNRNWKVFNKYCPIYINPLKNEYRNGDTYSRATMKDIKGFTSQDVLSKLRLSVAFRPLSQEIKYKKFLK